MIKTFQKLDAKLNKYMKIELNTLTLSSAY